MELIVNDHKLGRNDPCHCGSGQKYKKCCLDGDQKREAAVKNFNPERFRFEMEKMMGQMRRLVESKDMSIEDLNRYFVGRTMDDIEDESEFLMELNPRAKAQDMIYEAREMNPGKKRREYVEKALEIYPNLPDAYDILMQESAAYTSAEALPFYEKAVAVGELDLGEGFFKENEGHFWGILETRPYMRAKVYLAQILWELGREEEAILHYQDCIRLNPTDNQGVRDPLLSCLLIRNDLDAAEILLKQYKDDWSASHSYNKALFFFKKHGAESKKAAKQLAKALEENPFVPNYLLGRKKMPRNIPDSYAIGSKEEAIIYTSESLRAWKETPEALAWLTSGRIETEKTIVRESN